MDDLSKKLGSFLDKVFTPAVYSSGDTSRTPKQATGASQPQGSQKQKSVDPVEIKIMAGLNKYKQENNINEALPIEQYVPLMVQASKKYPIFQKHPGLLPAVSIIETSGGRNFKLNNNPLSWAARVQQAGNYKPSSSEQSITDMITAVGGDQNRGAGYDPNSVEFKNRQGAIAPYQKFRDSGNLEDFTNAYDGGNKKYYPALVNALKYFNS